MLRLVIAAVWITVAGSAPGAAQSTPLDTGGHYADVHGIRTYYYVTGTGTPLVLLHGAFSSIETDFGAMLPELAQAYARMAPHPEQWAMLVEQIEDLDLTDTGIDTARVKTIRAPGLLIVGDGDVVRPEHTVQMFRLLGGGVPADIQGIPNSHLAVLPGTTHVTLLAKGSWLVSMVNEFLAAPVRP